MAKVVYNACFGGFGLSRKAAERLAQLGLEGMDQEIEEVSSMCKLLGEIYRIPDGVPRHHPLLVQVVEEFGPEASGAFADLQIKNIRGKKYIINEYDGKEAVQTPEDIEWIVVK